MFVPRLIAPKVKSYGPIAIVRRGVWAYEHVKNGLLLRHPNPWLAFGIGKSQSQPWTPSIPAWQLVVSWAEFGFRYRPTPLWSANPNGRLGFPRTMSRREVEDNGKIKKETAMYVDCWPCLCSFALGDTIRNATSGTSSSIVAGTTNSEPGVQGNTKWLDQTITTNGRCFYAEEY